ncbi:MAG TPA: glycosyltransferase family 1 protein [Gemmatimonas aurantiaca]|uniref:Glycosyltransferase n=2 Tax=Gemmatimonas aurantiaca TaxID=173480 RepID=C1A666_GEMAT|nr:glycosyltransferase family 1 protein [Gemmatimonas aurantiaca]BAH37726.1 glycosyltransferase [Gemmatimonas aurantiaca T-27]HCT58761.1 glycosyltransferase family 1 protein [Gemmatimonas aurantiaca]
MSSPGHASVPLRLALFTDTFTPQVNGVARTLARLVDAVQERDGTVRVFTVADDADAMAALPDAAADAATVERFPGRRFWAYPQLRLAWPARRDIRRQLEDFRPTIVHAATEFGIGLAGRAVARELDVPFVSSYHTSFTAYAEHYGLGMLAEPGWHYLRWFHNGGLRTYCPTQSIIREIEAHGFQQCREWSRGVDSARFSPTHRSSALRAQLDADDNTLVVSYIGRLGLEKGLDVVLGCMQQLHATCPERVRFLIVGDGPYEETVRASAPTGTLITGRLDGHALSEAFASSDVLLFPSTTDTFGNVLLEAMASGTPVIGADVGPTREQLAPDRGWLVRPGDTQAFTDAVLRLLADPDTRLTAQAKALAFASSKRWDVIWDTLIDDYRALQMPWDSRERASTSR